MHDRSLGSKNQKASSDVTTGRPLGSDNQECVHSSQKEGKFCCLLCLKSLFHSFVFSSHSACCLPSALSYRGLLRLPEPRQGEGEQECSRRYLDSPKHRQNRLLANLLPGPGQPLFAMPAEKFITKGGMK